MKAIYRHRLSGDLFAIETDEAGRVIASCGPLFGASIASLLLTTEAVVSEIPEKKEAPAMPPGGGMGGMGGMGMY